MEREQIIKALECCQTEYERNCQECPYEVHKKRYISVVTCGSMLRQDLLTLIKELTAELTDERAKGEMCAECIARQDKKLAQLTEKNERLKKDNEYILTQHAFQRRPSGDCWNDVIEKAKADTVREIFKEIYSSLDYIEEQMEPEEIPECFFSVREDINALKEKFESEGAADEI